MPPEVRDMLESLSAIAARLGPDGVHGKHHQGGCSKSGVGVSCAAPFRQHVEAHCMPLEEGLRGEGQLAVGAQEDLRRRSCVTLYNFGENGENCIIAL